MKRFCLSFFLVAGLVLGPVGTLQARPQAVPDIPSVPVVPAPAATVDDADREPDKAADEAASKPSRRRHRDVIRNFDDYHVKAGEVVHDLVVNGGSVQIDGEVEGDVVVTLGSVTVTGHVQGDVVNVGRGVYVEDGARVEGDVVAVGYGLKQGSDGLIKGRITNLGPLGLPAGFRDRVVAYFEQCVLLARPLAPRIGWLWITWGILLVLHALLGFIFPGAVNGIIRVMEQRPGGTALLGILGLPLVLVAALIIAATGVGLVAIPFLFTALVVGLCLGRVAIYQFLGARMLGWFGMTDMAPVLQFCVGAALTTVLFLVPVVGLVTWLLFVLWALGGLLMALFSRERPAKAAPAPAAPFAPASVPVYAPTYAPAPSPAAPGSPPSTTALFATTPADSGGPTVGIDGTVHDASPGFPTGGGVSAAAVAAPTTGPALPAAGITPGAQAGGEAPGWRVAEHGPALDSAAIAAARRPEFFRRFGALLIDWLPLLILVEMLPDRISHFHFSDYFGWIRALAAVAYYTWMLTWRGTTLGGLITGLRVVRVDGRPLTRDVALVRACGALISVPLGIGWFWASWDPRGQTWHDKLAGTVVIRDDTDRSLI